jgi:TetR/AcrR family transcriptional regulator
MVRAGGARRRRWRNAMHRGLTVVRVERRTSKQSMKRGKMPKTKALAVASSTKKMPAKKSPVKIPVTLPVKGPARQRAKPAVRSASAVSRRLRQIEDKRSAILGAALGLFSRFGLHGTSIDQVAARADVSKSNLLYYFANKEELYVNVLRDLLALWLEPLRGFSAEQDPAEAIGGYIRRKLVVSRDRPDASRLFCLEMIQGAPLLRDELDRELRTLVERKSEVIRSWIAAGKLAPVDPHHLIFTLWAVTQHYADFGVQVQALTGHTLEDPAFFEQAVENVQRIVLQGIAPR